MRPTTGVWATPMSSDEYALLEKTRQNTEYEGEYVLLFEGKVVAHCADPLEFGDIAATYRNKRAFATFVRGDRPPMPRIM